MNYQINLQNRGFSLVEILIGFFILSFLFYLIIISFSNLSNILTRARINLQILSVLEDELEKIRVMDYENIGLINGWPRGNLPSEKIINKSGLEIKVKYFVRNIDDPKDGTVTSTPQDRAPADYKLVELEGECVNCNLKTKKQVLTAIVAPKTVESITNNGSMFIQVIDANGKPVSLANVRVIYQQTPTFTIDDLTDVNGFLRLIDIPPGLNAYRIYVSKDNYSSERTYPPGDPSNPNPILPDQTVRAGGLTTVSFQIDKLSTLNLTYFDKLCKPTPNVNFSLKGEKLIGRNPDILKTDIVTTTDEYGKKTLILEWDNYKIDLIDSRYVLQGSSIYLRPSLIIQPGNNYSINLTLASSSPINLLVSVLDQNKNYLEEATVTLIKGSISLTKITGEEYVNETDWSNNNYSEITDGIDVNSAPGDIKLLDLGGYFSTSTEYLISKTIDLGISAPLLYKKFQWTGYVPANTSIKFQLASNNDNSTWNFIGPDGTSNTYFEANEFQIPGILSNKRYFRYKVYLQTTDPTVTPILRDVNIFYSSACLSPGQVLFQNLSPGNYTLEVLKTDYQTKNETITLSNSQPYQEVEVILSRQ